MLKMTKKKFGTKSIALMGVLIAVVVVFSRFFAYETTFLKISFTFIPESLIGMIFG
ncbi:folate family ECF transporter S component, partial [Enterococcus faecium]